MTFFNYIIFSSATKKKDIENAQLIARYYLTTFYLVAGRELEWMGMKTNLCFAKRKTTENVRVFPAYM